MHKVLITGVGKIGALIATLLQQTGDYAVAVADMQFEGQDARCLLQLFPDIEHHTVDINDNDAFSTFLSSNNFETIISSLPYFVNIQVAEQAKRHGLNYFDLTEDTKVTSKVSELAADASQAFVPQCGLAPGFISIIAASLMQHFDELDAVKLRVGALPQFSNNALQYALTWSTDGLINEYGNSCYAIRRGQLTKIRPLEGLEMIQLDGEQYEAFNTSGGLGSLAETFCSKVQHLDYKTIRFPGHCEKMRVLMEDLKLNQDRGTLKYILENAVPKTYQDIVIVYVSVTGKLNGTLLEESYMKKVYPQEIAGRRWSAIQITTAAGICAVVDMIHQQPNKYTGLIKQEDFSAEEFLANRFGSYYQ